MSLATEQNFRDFYPEAEDATDNQLGPIVRTAGRWVARLAVPPAEYDPEYDQAAKDAELQISRHLYNSHLRSESGGVGPLSTSTSYSGDLSVIRQIVREALGNYAGSRRPVDIV